jgi:hypothetical protein
LISLPPLSSLLSGLVMLFPIGIYCLVLARLNRRPHPFLVTGIHDAAGLLLALSGVLFFIGPSMLTGFNYRPRDIWLYNHYSALKGLGRQWWWVGQLSLWLLYGVVVLGGCYFFLRTRRRVTAVYNVEASALEVVLAGVLDRLGLEWSQAGNRIFFRARPAFPETARREPVPAPHSVDRSAPTLIPNGRARVPRPASPGEGQAALACWGPVGLLELNHWPRLRHVTLHWSPEAEPWRGCVEAELAFALEEVWTRANPAGTWLMAVSAVLFVGLFFLTVLFQVARLLGDGW